MNWSPLGSGPLKRHRQPHYVWVLPPSVQRDTAVAATLAGMEVAVPGVLVYARVQRKLVRIADATAGDRTAADAFEVHCPLNAAWIVDALLDGVAAAAWPSPECAGIEAISDDPDVQDEYRARADVVVARFRAEGLLTDAVPPLTAYQRLGIGIGLTRPWQYLRYPTGSGKTLTTLVLALATIRPGRCGLVISPARARGVWWQQARTYTALESYRVLPAGDARESDESLRDFLVRVKRDRLRGLVSVGGELVSDYLAAIKAVAPVFLAFDEIGELAGNTKRWSRSATAEGDNVFTPATTKASRDAESRVSGRLLRGAGLAEAAALLSIERRIGLDATPLTDGRVRRLWAQFDLLGPGQVGYSSRPWRIHYCAGTPAAFGGEYALEDRGSSNLDELGSRLSFLVHDVDARETARDLPPVRVEVVWVPREEQNKADAGAAEIKAAAKAVPNASDPRAARGLLVELHRALAASRKRSRVVADVCSVLRGGGRVVVFTSRRLDVERWAAALESAMPALAKGDRALPEAPWVVWAHGDTPEAERERMLEAFSSATTPGVFVGTGQAFGASVDAFKFADLLCETMIPLRPGDLIQRRGRVGRLGGVPSVYRIYLAEGTRDERDVEILTAKFGPIEKLFSATELDGLETMLLGIDDEDALLDAFMEGL